MARGGKREGAGRPTGTTGAYKETKRITKGIRFTPEEWAKVEALAAEKKITASAYIRNAILGKPE
jgi:hypothetical protein